MVLQSIPNKFHRCEGTYCVAPEDASSHQITTRTLRHVEGVSTQHRRQTHHLHAIGPFIVQSTTCPYDTSTVHEYGVAIVRTLRMINGFGKTLRLLHRAFFQSAHHFL
jgi:hypothetical protein